MPGLTEVSSLGSSGIPQLQGTLEDCLFQKKSDLKSGK